MQPRSLTLLAAGLAAGLALVPRAAAQCSERSALTSATQAANDHFGQVLATDGVRIVVGAPDQNCPGTDSGGVYVFHFDGVQWLEEGHLCPSDAAASDNFGSAVDVDGDRIVVGSRHHDQLGSQSGAAYVFRFTGGAWSQEVKLLASDGGAGDEFGASVAIQGTEVIVGAPYHDDVSTDRGAAYVFLYTGSITGWQEDQLLQHSTGASFDEFGAALDLDGDRLAIGTPRRFNNDAGEISVFERVGGSWQENAFVTSVHAGTSEYLGQIFDLRGDRLAVGLPADDLTATNSGSVLIFDLVGGVWQETAYLGNPGAESSAQWGSSVALGDGLLASGAPLADRQVTDGGIVYSFVRHGGSWYFDQPFGVKNPAAGSQLGASTVIVDRRAFSGAPYEDRASSNSGAVLEHLIGDFLLEANASSYAAGDTLDVDMSCGTPTTPAWFAIFAVNGTPFFQILLRVKFDASHSAGFTTTVPAGLSGIDLTFLSFKLAAWGQATDSNLLTLSFQ